VEFAAQQKVNALELGNVGAAILKKGLRSRATRDEEFAAKSVLAKLIANISRCAILPLPPPSAEPAWQGASRNHPA
jgi:hypothetical protein